VGRYRTRLEIISDVLEVASKGARKTQIMYGANLSYTLLCRYLEDVVNMGLINKKKNSVYILTRKGSDFLEALNDYFKHLEEVEGQLIDVEHEKSALFQKFLDLDYD
jgi:predicted transcriptional regulator